MKTDLTIENIQSNKSKFESALYKKIEALIDFAINRSPLSDMKFISDKLNLDLFPIEIENNRDWVPVRNVLRLIAKLADENLNETQITSLRIQDMLCGCDYFEGNFIFKTSDGIVRGGVYKWKWTAFPGHDKHYNKFVIFSNEIKMEEVLT